MIDTTRQTKAVGSNEQTQAPAARFVLGCDIGGTFTDFVLYDAGTERYRIDIILAAGRRDGVWPFVLLSTAGISRGYSLPCVLCASA